MIIKNDDGIKAGHIFNLSTSTKPKDQTTYSTGLKEVENMSTGPNMRFQTVISPYALY